MQSETDFQAIEARLEEWHGRKQTADLLLWLPRGLLAGLLVGVLIAAMARLRPLLTNAEVGYVSLICAAVGLLGAFAYIALQKRTPLQRAQLVDETYGLQERFSTALELREGRITTEPTLAKRQIADARQHAQDLNVADGVPLAIHTQDWGIILAAILLLTAAVYFPNPQTAVLTEQRAVEQAIENQIEALETLAEQILQNEDLTPEQQNELLEPILEAQQQLQEGNLTPQEGMATLAEAEAELRELAESNDNSGLIDQLQAAGESLANNETSQEAGEALQNGDLSGASEALSELAQQLPNLTAEQQATLAEDLAETAAALAENNPELAQQLAEAAEALQNGDVEAAQEALQEASEALGEAGQQQAAAEQANAAAEQLQEGQQAVAQAGQEQEGEGQPGEGQDGQGVQQGEGQQQGQGGEGQGQGDESQGQGGDSTAGLGEEPGAQGGVGQGGGPGETVFVPEFIDLSDIEGQEVELPAECVANPAECGSLLDESPTDFTDEQALVPYNQVYGEYRDAAYEALNEDYVPLGMKGYIRDYFSSLEPNTQE